MVTSRAVRPRTIPRVALEQAEARTQHMQARATAIDDLMQAGSFAQGMRRGESVEDMMLDPGEARAVEQEIEALKRDIARAGVNGGTVTGQERP